MGFSKSLLARHRLKKYSSYETIAIILFAWSILISWRPFVLGFYHDDWASSAWPIGMGNDLIEIIYGDPGRPLYAVIMFFMRLLFPGNPFGFQFVLAILNLFCAVGIGCLVTRLFSNLDIIRANHSISKAGCFSAILWLSFPWSLGYSAWPIMIPPLFAMFLTILGCILLTSRIYTAKTIFLSTIFLVLPFLIYEATWFIWLPIIIIIAIQKISRDEINNKFVFSFCNLTFLQILFIGINRFAFSQGPTKKFTINFLGVLQNNFSIIKPALASIIGSSWILLIIGFIALLALLFYTLVFSKDRRLVLSQLFLIFIGFIGTQLLYSMAGYGLALDGLSSRVTLPLNLWLVLFLGCVFSSVSADMSKLKNGIIFLIFSSILLPCAYGLIKQSIFWKKSWEEQITVLQQVPESVLSLVSDDAILLLELPKGTPPVYTFNAFWDINGAIMYKIRNTKKVDYHHIYATIAGNGEIKSCWDGKKLTQYWCREPNQSLWNLEGAEKLFYWRYGDYNAIQLEAPYSGGCSK